MTRILKADYPKAYEEFQKWQKSPKGKYFKADLNPDAIEGIEDTHFKRRLQKEVLKMPMEEIKARMAVEQKERDTKKAFVRIEQTLSSISDPEKAKELMALIQEKLGQKSAGKGRTS